jgi:hypothetical protein
MTDRLGRVLPVHAEIMPEVSISASASASTVCCRVMPHTRWSAAVWERMLWHAVQR